METTNIEEINLSGQFFLLILAFLFSLIILSASKNLGYFRYPKYSDLNHHLSFFQVLGAFSTFLLLQLLVIPFILTLYMVGVKGKIPAAEIIKKMDPLYEGWFNVAAMTASFLAVVCFYKLQDITSRKLIWQREHDKGFLSDLKSLGVGAMSWLIAYPIVFFVGQGIGLLFYLFFGLTEQEQVAVRSLKNTLTIPVLNISMIVCMAVLVPIMEELLFRGFLLTWLRGKMGMFKAIGLSSLIFALFHFSLSQGISNIEYIVALFILSCFLGFLYEREQSLWAPIGLHVAFNTISISIISIL